MNGIKHHLHTSSVSHQKTSIKQQHKIDSFCCWVLSLIFFLIFLAHWRFFQPWWVQQSWVSVQPLSEEHLATWFYLFGLLTFHGLLFLALTDLRLLHPLSPCCCVFFFFFLPVSYFSLSLLWLSFFYARSANVIFRKMFSSEIALNIWCVALQSQNWPISSYLSILNYLYPSRRIW